MKHQVQGWYRWVRPVGVGGISVKFSHVHAHIVVVFGCRAKVPSTQRNRFLPGGRGGGGGGEGIESEESHGRAHVRRERALSEKREPMSPKALSFYNGTPDE